VEGEEMEDAVAVRSSIPIVRVSDIKAAEAFYCSVLGFQKRGEYLASPDGPAYMTVSLGSSVLHISSFPGDGALGSAVYFDVDDVDSLYDAFRKSGLEDFALEPTDQTWGRREIYVRDPDGNCLRFGAQLP
jgi:catechol 2,3-dioxygenase-like lactoylglutathione lyase family enzyme